MRRLGPSMLMAGLGLALGLTASMLLWPTEHARAQGGTGGCWGSICQTKGGVTITVPVNAPFISLSTVQGARQNPGDLTIACERSAVIGPGFGGLTLRGRPGTTPGTTQLVAISGNGFVETPIGPPIPGGSC